MLAVTSYKANCIQFGLDQLLEAPSQHQALFVHWAKWCYDLMSIIIMLVIALNFCKSDTNMFKVSHFAPLAMFVTPFIFFCLSNITNCWLCKTSLVLH